MQTLVSSPLTKKPSAGFLQAGHPLAAGLRLFMPCWDNGGAPVDLVTPGRVSSASATWRASPKGRSMKGAQWTNASTADLDFTSGPWTVASYFRVWVAPGGSNFYTAFGRTAYTSEANNQGWEIQLLGGSAGFGGGNFIFNSSNNNANTSYRLPSVTGVAVGDWMIVGTSDGTTRRIHVNGREEASTANNPSPASSGGALRDNTNDGSADVGVYWNAAWARDLKPAEIRDLWLAPWSLVRQQRRLFRLAGPDPGQVATNTIIFTAPAPTPATAVTLDTAEITVTAPGPAVAVTVSAPEILLTAPTVLPLGLLPFHDTLAVAAPLRGPRFRDQVHIVQAPLASFRDTVAIRRALQPFSDRLRVLPADIRTLFDSDIQRPVGRVEEV